jgi:hypothetical protein
VATLGISEVKIANMALAHIGGSATIESITEQSEEARKVDLWYDFARRQTLAIADWNFARARQVLATDAEDPPTDIWAYRYQYPTDAVVIRKIENQYTGFRDSDPVPFEIELNAARNAKTILTDLSDAEAVFTLNVTNTPLFTEFFVEMFSMALAAKIAYSITGKKSVREQMINGFNSMARIAPASNANESMRPPLRDADYIRGR